MDTNFAHYICGLIDGEGYFGILAPCGSSKQYNTQFVIRLRSDDYKILEEIQSSLGGIGTLKIGPPTPGGCVMASWRVLKLADQVKLIAFLDVYPLRAKKRHEWALWRNAVMEKATKKPNERDLEYMNALCLASRALK